MRSARSPAAITLRSESPVWEAGATVRGAVLKLPVSSSTRAGSSGDRLPGDHGSAAGERERQGEADPCETASPDHLVAFST